MSEVIITVRGEHEARVTPEEGVARLSVRAEGPDRAAVVDRVVTLSEPLRHGLSAYEAAGTVREWSSQRVSVWANRPWNSEGTQLPLVHYAAVELTATFTDFDALSAWLTETASVEAVQIDGVEWRLSPATERSAEAEVAASAVRVAVDRATAYAAAIDRSTVTPLEIADLGLLTQGRRSSGGAPETMRMATASFAADAARGTGTFEFQPEDIVVTAAVEARFSAR